MSCLDLSEHAINRVGVSTEDIVSQSLSEVPHAEHKIDAIQHVNLWILSAGTRQ